MQWFLLTALVLWLSVAEVCGGVIDPAMGQNIVITDLQIVGIDNVDDTSYKVSCDTTFEDTGSTIKKISLVKNIYDDSEVDNLIGEDGTLVPCSVTITDEIKNMGGKEIGLLLQGLDESNFPVVRGTTQRDTFPNFPTGNVQITAATDNDLVHLVRVSASSLGDLELEDTDAVLLASSATGAYYTKNADPAGDYKLCSKFDTDVLICDVPKTVTSDTLTKTGTVESATLRYSSLEIEVTVTDFVGTQVDVAHSNILCNGAGLTATCNEGITISSAQIDMKLIGLDVSSGIMKDYLEHMITDYNIIGQAIDSSSLEVRWDFQVGKERYYIQHDQEGVGDFQAASVTCDGGSMNLPCFGYFTDLTPDDYIVTVQPKTGSPPNEVPDETNRIESDIIPVSASKLSDRQIKHLQLNWHYNEQSENIDVCFNHASHNIERVFSHYEFVLINKTGQWLKHKLLTQDTEGDLCFSTFGVASEAFDACEGATLIVTQRAEDGFTVLASGKTSVTFI